MMYTRTIEIRLEIDDELLDVLNENYYESHEENISSLDDLEIFLDRFSDDEILSEFENSESYVTSGLVDIDEEMLDKMQKIC